MDRRFLLSPFLAAGLVAGYAFYVEPRWLRTARVEVRLDRLPPALDGIRVGLMTDLHGGGGTPLSLVRRAARRLMRERPHLIALTGDFVAQDGTTIEAVLAQLDGLRAPLGIFAVPGNHDHRYGMGRWLAAVRAHPRIENLTNRSVELGWQGERIVFSGLDDLDRGRPREEVLERGRGADLHLVLAHNPEHAETLRDAEVTVDLVVAGHTHGGQVRVPGIGALRNPVEHPDLYDRGLTRRPWTTVYTSRGVGTVHLPVRFFDRPEVAVLTLRPRTERGAPREKGAARS